MRIRCQASVLAIKIPISSWNKENIRAYKKKLHEVREMTWNEENLIYLVCSESPLLTPLNMLWIDSS
jgi:hypothetical protein